MSSLPPVPVKISALNLSCVQNWKTQIIKHFQALEPLLPLASKDDSLIRELFEALKTVYEIANEHRCSPMSGTPEEILDARSMIGFIHNTKNKMLKAEEFFSRGRRREAHTLVSSLQYQEQILEEPNQTLAFMSDHFKATTSAFSDYCITITIDESAKAISGEVKTLTAIHSAIENLLMNAIQYAGKFGPIHLSITLKEDSAIEVAVRDHSKDLLSEEALSKINSFKEECDDHSLSPARLTSKSSPTSWGMGLAQSFSELALFFEGKITALAQIPWDESTGTKTLKFDLPIAEGVLLSNARGPQPLSMRTPERRMGTESRPDTCIDFSREGSTALAFMTSPPPTAIKPAPTSPLKRPDRSDRPPQYIFILVEDDRTNQRIVKQTFDRISKIFDWQIHTYSDYEALIHELLNKGTYRGSTQIVIALDSTVSGSWTGKDFLDWTLTPEASCLKDRAEFVWYSDPIAALDELYTQTQCRVYYSKKEALNASNFKALIEKVENGVPALSLP